MMDPDAELRAQRARTEAAENHLRAFLDEEAYRFFSSLPVADRLAAKHFEMMSGVSGLAIVAWQAAQR